MSTKSDVLGVNAKKAIDAIVADTDLDDDSKEEVLEEIQEYIDSQMKLLSGDDEEDEIDEDDIEEDDEE